MATREQVLQVLQKNSPASTEQVRHGLGITAEAASMHLLRLQRRGLVHCIRGPEGKVVYCITDKGRARLGGFPKRSEFLNKGRNIQYETLLFLRGPVTVMVKPDWPYNFIVQKRTLYSAVDLTEKLGILRWRGGLGKCYLDGNPNRMRHKVLHFPTSKEGG